VADRVDPAGLTATRRGVASANAKLPLRGDGLYPFLEEFSGLTRRHRSAGHWRAAHANPRCRFASAQRASGFRYFALKQVPRRTTRM
jgi:hypothetical protein